MSLSRVVAASISVCRTLKILFDRCEKSRLARPALGPLAALSILQTASATSSQAHTMALPGCLDVNAGGAAVYSIQIAVPPGTAGMHPILALEYTSQAANGIVGVGGCSAAFRR